MLKETYNRYCAIEARLDSDEELSMLKRRLQAESAALNRVLGRLPEEDRAVITEYLGILAEIDQRIVEIACFSQ